MQDYRFSEKKSFFSVLFFSTILMCGQTLIFTLVWQQGLIQSHFCERLVGDYPSWARHSLPGFSITAFLKSHALLQLYYVWPQLGITRSPLPFKSRYPINKDSYPVYKLTVTSLIWWGILLYGNVTQKRVFGVKIAKTLPANSPEKNQG